MEGMAEVSFHAYDRSDSHSRPRYFRADTLMSLEYIAEAFSRQTDEVDDIYETDEIDHTHFMI